MSVVVTVIVIETNGTFRSQSRFLLMVCGVKTISNVNSCFVVVTKEEILQMPTFLVGVLLFTEFI